MPPIPNTEKPYLRGLDPEELTTLLDEAGFDAFRGKQLFHWLHVKYARSLDEMKNLPKPLRAWLAEHTELGGISSIADQRSSADGSTKFLFQLSDGKKVEGVLMPDHKRGYWTMCISSQVGCAVDCKFCLTGFSGFFRNMRVDEIVDQVLFGRRWLKDQHPQANFRNIVFMGMGEPLLNTDAVIKTIRLLLRNDGADFSPRRISVSTSGIVPGIDALGASGTNACIAISLNAPNQELREQIMPITRKYPLTELIEAVRRFPMKYGKRPIFEYVLLAGVNDRIEHAEQIVQLLRGMPCKINLIPFNPSPLLPYQRPEMPAVEAFTEYLVKRHFTVSVRWSKALDISGACGNLATDHRQRAGRPAPNPAPMPGDELGFFATATVVGSESAADDEDDD